MNERSRNNWFVAGTMMAVTLVPVLIVMTVLIGARGPDPADARAPDTPAAAPSDVSAVPLGAAPVAVDSPTAMVEQHQAMMDQMRVSVSPAMNEMMNGDPMWQMMRSGAFVALLEEHEQDIDRMLARGG